MGKTGRGGRGEEEREGEERECAPPIFTGAPTV